VRAAVTRLTFETSGFVPTGIRSFLESRAGQVVLQLKSPYKDGTTHIVMEPLEFMERLAALVPRPRLHSDSLPWRAGAQREVAQ
jgi:hypothetical protein